MNEEEARERCKQIIKDNNEIIKEARKNRDINSMQLTASLDNDSIAIETVLNLLEKKDKIIDEIQEEVLDHIGFENRLKRDNREPDLFNQGRFYVANNINNILKGK